MSAKIINGEEVARQIREELVGKVSELQRELGVTPGLATVLVGGDPASKVYVNMKEKDSKSIGLYFEKHELPEETNEEDLLALIDKLNKNPKIHGILVQLPLPKHINESRVLEAVTPEKDVDGFHPINIGKLVIGEDTYLPCTPRGVYELLRRYQVKTEGAEVVIAGRSNIVGKPMALILLQKTGGADATVTVCHSRTRNLASHTRQADILVAAMGRPKAITKDMVKEGAVVIDVGVNRTDQGLVGDVDFENVKEKASAITPVPGGVGPMTRAMLMANTLEAAKRQISR